MHPEVVHPRMFLSDLQCAQIQVNFSPKDCLYRGFEMYLTDAENRSLMKEGSKDLLAITQASSYVCLVVAAANV